MTYSSTPTTMFFIIEDSDKNYSIIALMEYLSKQLTKEELHEFEKKYFPYTKITVDIENNHLVIGCELHADGEPILIEHGADTDNIWGGGINFVTKDFDTTAVLNLRPRLGNASMELLDTTRREKFFKVARYIFAEL